MLEGYHKYEGQPGHSIKGGCGLYIRNDITYTDRKKLNVSYCDANNEFQMKWVEIINKKHVNTIVGVVYRHPRKTSDETFLSYLGKTLTSIGKENKNVILMGDFNYCLLNYDCDNWVKSFVDLTNENKLQPCILEPTRVVPGQRPSLVDNIFTNILDKEIISGNITSVISEHMPNFAIFRNQDTDRGRRKIMCRDFDNFSENDFLRDLQFIYLDLQQGVNGLCSQFQEQMLRIFDIHAPMKTLSNREKRWKRKPWLTKGIQKAIRTKQMYYSKYIKSNKSKFWYHRYKTHRNRLEHLTRLAKEKYYQKYFQDNIRNSKKVWSKINELIHQRKSKQSTDIYLNENGSLITEQNKVANIFNKYYTNIASKLVDKLPKINTKYQDYLKNPTKNAMYLSEIEPDEVMKILLSLDITKSADIYNISPKLLKLAAPVICDYLTVIFNKSFDEGTFPDLLKVAKVIPVHKSGSAFEASNYRPISLLPIISKVLEKLMHNRLYSFLKKEKILYKRQYGFQKKQIH